MKDVNVVAMIKARHRTFEARLTLCDLSSVHGPSATAYCYNGTKAFKNMLSSLSINDGRSV